METKKVRTYLDWSTSTNANIERLMDNAAYSTAHPDDTLVIVGPPRLPAVTSGDTASFYQAFDVVGMLQNISINQQKPFQPLMAIGSSRSFFVASKAQGSAQIQRLFMNTDNILRRLYANSIDGPSNLEPYGDADNPASSATNKNFLINLDSEFFLVPFGLGIIYKNKARAPIGGLYMELAVIPNYTVAIQAGQSMIMEAVSVFFDRLVPLPVNGDTEKFLAKYNSYLDPNSNFTDAGT